MIQDVTDGNFQQQVIKSTTRVLVDFWAPWCGPCKALGPILKEFMMRHPEIKVVKVNIDHSPRTAQLYNVVSIPLLLFFENGNIINRFTGNPGNVRRLERLLFE